MASRPIELVPIADIKDAALSESDALRAAADRLYPPGDHRAAVPLPADVLGMIRHVVRSVADRLETTGPA